MKYGSLCSGIEAATQAWHPLGWKPAFFSEIEKFPSAVLAHHYPDVPNHGDMTKFEDWPDHAIDLLVGGTPCQSFSVAGLRKGLADPRGNLMLTFGAVAQRYRPKWIVWENVPGVLSSDGGRDFGTFLGMLAELGYGFAYRVLDAQYVRVGRFTRAVPQRRRRVFVVGYLGDWRRAAAVLFDGESLSWNPAPRREAGEVAPGPVGESTDGCCAVAGCDRPAEKRGWCNTHYQKWRTTGVAGTGPVRVLGRPDADRFWEKVDTSGECWRYTGAKNDKGYGKFWKGSEKRLVQAHRFAFEDQVGLIPDGLQLDHLCRNPACVRPDHLEPVTSGENTRRGNAGKWSRAAKVAPTISARPTGGGGLGTDFDLDGGVIAAADVAPGLTGNPYGDHEGREGLLIANSGEVGYCLTASAQQSLDAETETLIAVAHALRGEGHDASEDGSGRGTPIVPIAIQKRAVSENPDTGPGGAGYSTEGAAYTLEARNKVQAVAFDLNQITSKANRSQPDPDVHHTLPATSRQPHLASPWAVRRLTPTECERLQAFPDGFTRIPYRGKPAEACPDGPRYRALGNSMAVNVMEWIGERIALVEGMK